MRSDDPSGASKKRKRSRRRIPKNIVYHPALPAVSFSPMLNTLNEAYQSALSDEALAAARPIQRMEDWNWELSAVQIAGLSHEELTIWKDLLVCLESLRLAGITVHPANWTIPVGYNQQQQPCKHHAWMSTRQDDAVRFAAKSLNEPNILDPAQSDAYTLIKNDLKAYECCIRAQAEAWKPDLVTGLAGRSILQPVE
ncbi:hypothetical protein B0H17DRAFT_1074026 [Mycena rosella]|uniref:Uncharacterized protein n=1 Tax=Mycena rosella TaxID=1033263 RepID=A0AAD7D8K1_MYCRO|nr:hypothetical protein B0H17DRAFT_1074026 [Mycena rosella]